MALLGQLSAWNCSAGNIRSAGPRICEKRAEIGSVCEDDAIAYPVPLRTERAFRAQCSIVTVSAGLVTGWGHVWGHNRLAETDATPFPGGVRQLHPDNIGSRGIGRYAGRAGLPQLVPNCLITIGCIAASAEPEVLSLGTAIGRLTGRSGLGLSVDQLPGGLCAKGCRSGETGRSRNSTTAVSAGHIPCEMVFVCNGLDAAIIPFRVS